MPLRGHHEMQYSPWCRIQLLEVSGSEGTHVPELLSAVKAGQENNGSLRCSRDSIFQENRGEPTWKCSWVCGTLSRLQIWDCFSSSLFPGMDCLLVMTFAAKDPSAGWSLPRGPLCAGCAHVGETSAAPYPLLDLEAHSCRREPHS